MLITLKVALHGDYFPGIKGSEREAGHSSQSRVFSVEPYLHSPLRVSEVILKHRNSFAFYLVDK
jgi:neutral trehalase